MVFFHKLIPFNSGRVVMIRDLFRLRIVAHESLPLPPIDSPGTRESIKLSPSRFSCDGKLATTTESMWVEARGIDPLTKPGVIPKFLFFRKVWIGTMIMQNYVDQSYTGVLCKV
jgi:hypothetical protein